MLFINKIDCKRNINAISSNWRLFMEKETVNGIITIWNSPKSETLANISKVLIKILLEGGSNNEQKSD
jgi:hypothetical protein